SDSDVFPVRRFECALQRDFRAFCDEVEGRPAFHDERFAGVVRQYENRNTIRWRVAPPAFPGIIRPGTANRSEHVAAENPGPDVLEATNSEIVIDSLLTAGATVPLCEGLGVEKPFEDFASANSERVFEILVWAGAETVQRDPK